MRLQELRVSNHLSQKQLGQILDMTQQRISLLEQEKSYPNSFEIIKYARYFEVSADYILEISSNRNELVETESLIHGSREIRLLRQYAKLNENLKKFILDMVETAGKYQEQE